MDDDGQPAPYEPRPRFLARTGRHGTYKKLPRTSPTDLGRWVYVESTDERDDDLGYTSTNVRALNAEPECVGPAILGDYAEVNRRIMSQQIVLEVAEAQTRRPELTAQNRLDTVRQRAKHAHVDMSHPVHLVQKAIDKARMRDQPVATSAVTRLEGLEALLDGVSIKRLAA
jgi:hypothetical protein